MKTQSKDYWKLFKASACALKLKGTTQADVFEELVDQLIKGKVIGKDLREPALQALREREALASTGVGQNVAIPHVKLPGIDEVAVGLSVHPEGVEWSSLDGDPVHIFFTVLRPERPGDRFDPERHLDMMRWISALGREPDFRRFARAATTRTELVELLKEMSAS